MNLGRIFFIFALSCSCAWAAGEKVVTPQAEQPLALDELDPLIPLEWREFFRLDRYNIPHYRKFGTTFGRVRPIYVWDTVAEDGLAFALASSYLRDDPSLNRELFALKEEDPSLKFKGVIRIYATDQDRRSDDDLEKFEEIKKDFGAPVKTLLGIKLLSQETWFVWDPTKLPIEPFQIKMFRLDGARAIFASDVLSTYLAADMTDSLVGMVPELSSVNVMKPAPDDPGLSDLHYGQIVRSMKVRRSKGAKELPASAKLLPLHGVLGSDKARLAAEKMGLTLHQWILREYLPKLARFSAEMNFRYGIFHASHTQNLMVYLDENTGEILCFVAKDFSDINVDPWYLVDRGMDPQMMKTFHSLAKTFPIRILNNEEEQAETPRNGEAGFFLANFLGQSVDGFETDLAKIREYDRQFLKKYIHYSQKQTGTSIALSPAATQAMKFLKTPPTGSEKSDDWGPWPTNKEAMQVVFQNVYDTITAKHLPKILPKYIHYSQNMLSNVFARNSAWNDVVWAFSGARQQFLLEHGILGYAFDGKGVIAYELKSGRIYGFAHGLTSEEKLQILTPRDACEDYVM